LREGLSVANAPGLIDNGYRGEIKVILVNLDRQATIDIKRGEKIAQLVIQAVEVAELEEVDELPSSERGSGGFGSTGP
jgi:dUTP pyrophosphatase